MKNITIKRDETLEQLAKVLSKEKSDNVSCFKDPDLLIEHILTVCLKCGYITDHTDDLKHDFIDHFLKHGDLQTKKGACLICTGSYKKEAADLFTKLKLWGTGDCPECGCESKESKDNKYTPKTRENPKELKYKEVRVCLNCNHEFQI